MTLSNESEIEVLGKKRGKENATPGG